MIALLKKTSIKKNACLFSCSKMDRFKKEFYKKVLNLHSKMNRFNCINYCTSIRLKSKG